MGALLVKVIMAAETYGTNDTRHWLEFAHAVRAVGPVRVYAFPFAHSLYNHPPGTGYFLLGIDVLTHIGFSVMFTMRTVASIADVLSALIVYEIVSARRSQREAVLSGIFVAASPVLFVISGFHGNTDPIFVMFALLATYLLADRSMPLLAGVALAVSFSLKIVPFVLVPTLLVYAGVTGRRTLIRFVGSMGVVAALIWLPAFATESIFIRKNVFGYTGSPARWWGLPQFGSWAGHPGIGTFMVGGGFKPLLFLCCALLPAIGVWRRPERVAECAALTLAGPLLLSPASATQYLVWAVSPAYVLGTWTASAYNLAAGAFLVHVYTRWSGSILWDRAAASVPTQHELWIATVAWLALLAVVVQGAASVITGDSLARRPALAS